MLLDLKVFRGGKYNFVFTTKKHKTVSPLDLSQDTLFIFSANLYLNSYI